MPSNHLLVGKLKVYQGYGTRCLLNGATVSVNIPQVGAVTRTTDQEGDLGGGPVDCDQEKPAEATLAVSKDGYKSVKLKVTIAWSGYDGTLGIAAVHMIPE